MGGELNAVANLANRLIDQRKRALAMAALVGHCVFQFMVRVLQQAERGVHIWLLGGRIAHAGRDGRGDKQRWRITNRNTISSTIVIVVLPFLGG